MRLGRWVEYFDRGLGPEPVEIFDPEEFAFNFSYGKRSDPRETELILRRFIWEQDQASDFDKRLFMGGPAGPPRGADSHFTETVVPNSIKLGSLSVKLAGFRDELVAKVRSLGVPDILLHN
jgi:hypothetical protein